MTIARLSWIGAAAFVAISAAVMVLVPPIPQDLGYHAFADRRVWITPNAGDVLSNIPFTVAGLWGLWLIFATPAGAQLAARTWTLPYIVFLVGVAFVGIGSAYYHWAPDNARLVWDRLPMSVAFMALFCTLIADRISLAAGKALLWPLVALGVGAVAYWAWTDDLRPYGLVQFLPILAALALCWKVPARGGIAGRPLAAMFVFYGLAKVFETGDRFIFDAVGGAVSGHTLKHLAAAAACTAMPVFIRGLQK